MLKVFKRLKSGSSRGDTYVEVLVSIVVLALVLTAAYVLATHSLSSSVDNTKRTKALSIGEGQISQLVNAQGALVKGLDKYTTVGTDFCISPDGSANTNTHDGDNGVKVCDADTAGYATGIKYDSSTGIFTITTQWARSGSREINQVQVYYKNPAKVAANLDACPNLNGIQTDVPAGYVKDTDGNCYHDVCPNLDGLQKTVPAGRHINGNGDCVNGGGGGPGGSCKCDDGSDCPNGDASQCSSGTGSCTCDDGSSCPGGDTGNCPSGGGNDGGGGCDQTGGFNGHSPFRIFATMTGFHIHFASTAIDPGGGGCDTYDCGGSSTNAGNCDDPDCSDPSHADDPQCTGSGDTSCGDDPTCGDPADCNTTGTCGDGCNNFGAACD